MSFDVSTRTADLALFSEPLDLQLDGTLHNVRIAYETYGHLNAAGDNAILLCHALTGNAHAATEGVVQSFDDGWWAPLIGSGRALDTDQYFVICSNILGSCYGSTGPGSIDASNGLPYGLSFPQITVRDMVTAQYKLLNQLHVTRVIVIGGSLGGMQVLEWALMYPARVRAIIPIATAAGHSPWAIAWNHVARQAILSDPEWLTTTGEAAPNGLSLARAIAMISYRAGASFDERFARRRHQGQFEVENYLAYQGQKLVRRFDPRSYVLLTRAMDLHDITAGRGSLPDTLGGIKSPALCVGISTDVLYPEDEQRQLASLIPDGQFALIDSPHGHDAFLIEFEQLDSILTSFLGELS